MSQAKLKVVENKTMDKENRNKSLEAAVSLIEKNYGKGSIMKLGSKTNVDIEAIEQGMKQSLKEAWTIDNEAKKINPSPPINFLQR